MLYVFLVDTGSMMTFDMNLAMGTVTALKEAIHDKTKIPEDKQVLLINGGEGLSPKSRVCDYSCAGTDSSPIFLFNKNTIEMAAPPAPQTDYEDVDLKDRVDSCLNMEPTYNTVIARTELAKQICEISTQQVRNCEKLVHDQHLQHQGWQAVVANLEDVISAFKSSCHTLEGYIDQFSQQRKASESFLSSLHEDLEMLTKIPLIDELTGVCTEEGDTVYTLFDWINKYSKNDQQRMSHEVADSWLQDLHRFDPGFLDNLKAEAEGHLEKMDNPGMKEIKGLADRLFGLDQLMAEAKKLATEQLETSTALLKNQQRFSNYKDTSLLPDLCKSHKMQLEVMSKNHLQLRDIRKRCIQAKWELSQNIHHRLKWIMTVSKKMTEIDQKIVIQKANIRNLKAHLDIIRQIHLTPRLYVSSVQEVVRRRAFSKIFLDWSSMISVDSGFVFKEETRLRQTFMLMLNNHFLSTLFPGINDILPSFALETPPVFDTELPALEAKHVDLLKEAAPELFQDMMSLDYDHQRILLKYLGRDSSGDNIDDREASKIKRLNDLTIEVDGVMFVKVSAVLKIFSLAATQIVSLKNDMSVLRDSCSSAMTQISSSVNDIETIVTKRFLEEMDKTNRHYSVSTEMITREFDAEKHRLLQEINRVQEAKNDVDRKIREKDAEFNSLKESSKTEIELLQKQISNVKMEILDREVELEEAKKKLEDQENDISQLKSKVDSLSESLVKKDQENKDTTESLVQENHLLKKEVDKLKQETHKIETRIEKELRKEFDAERSASLKLQKEQLKVEHKRELETLRSRFRLASSIEKAQDSLSLNSLESPSNFDYGTLASENMQMNEQIVELKRKHEEIIEEIKTKHNEELEAAKQVSFNEALNKLTREKDAVIAGLENDLQVLRQQLADKPINAVVRCSTPTLDSPFYQSLDPISKVVRLESMIREKDTRISKLQEAFRPPSTLNEKISVLSCDVNDLVLFYFDPKHNSYRVFSQIPVLHFLHSDSVKAISKNSNAGEPMNSWCLAIVQDKQFCQAKRSKNRYNVEDGTRFWIVKANPWIRNQFDPRKRMTSSVSMMSNLSSAQMPSSSKQISSASIANLSSESKEKTEKQSLSGEQQVLSTSCFPQLPATSSSKTVKD